MRRPDADLDLARAALLVAKEQYPQLSVEQYLVRLDALAEEVRDRLAGESAPLVVLQELVETLYGRHGFEGNREAYYDPRNSFLNDVLDRRTGIPLTLGIVFLEVGWRLGLPVQGVNFPHHFLVRFEGASVDLLIDPFDRGRTRFEDEAQELLDRFYGGMVRVRDSFLETATRREMLARLLTNLKGIWLNVRDDRRALSAVERILVVRPEAVEEHRAGGLLLARLGRRREAARHLQAYLDLAPSGSDRERIEGLLERLRHGDDVAVDPPEAPGAADVRPEEGGGPALADGEDE